MTSETLYPLILLNIPHTYPSILPRARQQLPIWTQRKCPDFI